jgi:hypothetical protein
VVAEASRTIALALALALARLASAAKVEEAAGPPCCAAAEAGEEERGARLRGVGPRRPRQAGLGAFPAEGEGERREGGEGDA